MKLIDRMFLKFCLWQMQAELKIGSSTGMNPHYLSGLKQAITDMQGDLLKLEINHG